MAAPPVAPAGGTEKTEPMEAPPSPLPTRTEPPAGPVSRACPACGAACDDSVDRCPLCGAPTPREVSCPHCQRRIHPEALKCRHCKRFVRGRPLRRRWRLGLALLAALLAIAVVVLWLRLRGTLARGPVSANAPERVEAVA